MKAADAYEIITGKKQEPFLGVLLTYPGKQEGAETGKSLPVYLSTPPHLPPDTLKTDTVKLGVLGAGLFANATLLPVLRKVKDVELVGIASAGGLHAAHSGKKFGFRYACSDDEQILNDPDINTVLILTRHDSHADLAVKALQAGKHVFVEKPLAVNDDQLLGIQEQLQISNHQLLTVGFNRRFAPLAQKLNDNLATRQEPLYMHYRVNAGYIPLNHWTHDPEQGGGRIIGEGCHFIDFLTFLAGSAPVSVSAVALPDGGKYRQDNVSMTFTFADGSIGIVDYLANGDKSFPKERVEVFCGGAVAVLDDFKTLETVRDGKRKTAKLWGQDKGHFNEMQALVRAIRAGVPPIPYEQLIGVTQASFAAVESIRKNGERVKTS